MENDNRLDLSLSLPCGGPSKGKNVTNSEESDRGSKIIDDFKNFLDGSNHKDDSKQDENLFHDLSKGPTNVEEGGKRKNVFDDINNQKRHEKDVYSSTENEDVADSEAGSEEVRVVSDSSNVDFVQSQRRFTISSEKEFKVGFSGQSGNIVMGSASNDRSGTQQPVIPANLPLMFGKSEGIGSHSLQYHPSYFGRPSPNSNTQNNGLKITQAATPVNGPNPYERVANDTKHAKEESPSLQPDTDTKSVNVTDQSKPDICPPEYPSIRPGISAELKFGGSGSSPNLPWVSTTGSGPNGKTISGVTYRFSGTQIRIVCACHGSHMSPEEFVQHANEEQPSFSNSNPSASAQD